MSKFKKKMVFDKILENSGKIRRRGERGNGISAAMLAVGYSPSYAKNPQCFTATKEWQELVEEFLPDAALARKHQALMEACNIQHYIFPRSAKKTELKNDEIRMIVESVPGCRLIYIKRDFLGAHAFYQAPDNRNQKEALDLAYRVKGKLAPTELIMSKRKYSELSNKDLMAIRAKLVKELRGGK